MPTKSRTKPETEEKVVKRPSRSKEKSEPEPESNEDQNSALIAIIKQDKRYKTTVTTLRNLLGDVNLEELHAEILGYQQLRGDRKPLALQQKPNKYLIRYASEDASYRSRASYIQSICRRTTNKVGLLLDAFDTWIMASYGTRLKGTVAIKNAIVSDLTHRLRYSTSDLYGLDDCCAVLLEDIDQGQWQRKAIISVLEIESRPEGKV